MAGRRVREPRQLLARIRDEHAPAGKHIGDYSHTLFGADAAYSWRHLQVWSEFFASRIEVPNVEDCDAVAYYVETKYQVTPQWFGALRWNQALFEKISNGEGRDIPWDRNAWRIDTASATASTATCNTSCNTASCGKAATSSKESRPSRCS